jgi:hypothetical protein
MKETRTEGGYTALLMEDANYGTKEWRATYSLSARYQLFSYDDVNIR